MQLDSNNIASLENVISTYLDPHRLTETSQWLS
jgi:hypothetical protein